MPTSHGQHRRSSTAEEPPSLPAAVAAGLAREHPPVHDLDSVGAQPRSESGPVGSAGGVLGELPELAAMLQAVVDADRLLVGAVVELAGLAASGQVETATGVPIEHWLAIVARQTRLDRRLLARMARMLDRFPALRSAATAGQVSFAQLRALTLTLRDAPSGIDLPLDRWLAAAIPHLHGADPDAVVEQARHAIVELAPDLQADQQTDTDRSRYLYLQPHLDGSGGRFHGELDATGLALLDEATAPRTDQTGHSAGATRADNLLERLTHTCTGDRAGGLPPVSTVLRIGLDALLDRDQMPAQLLTRLIGGKLWLSADAARQLIEQRGTQLRSVIIDDTGAVVGIGRRSRIPPDWLTEATLALHDTCTGPLCRAPARGAHTDHANPWWPTRPDQHPGSTNIDNLGPLCPTTNHTKEAAGWRATQTRDGRRTWHHPRTGLTITTIPTTWRPPGHHPPPNANDPPDGSDPPTAASSGDPPLTSASDPPDDDLPF